MNKVFAAALLFLTLTLSGCVMVRSDISVFHELTPAQPRLFVIAPLKDQEDSLEWKSYADRVKAQLVQKGFRDAPLEDADLVVFLNYGIDSGKQVISSYPIYGQTGVRSSYTTGTVTTYGNMGYVSGTSYNTPTYGVVGSGTASSTRYGRYLRLGNV